MHVARFWAITFSMATRLSELRRAAGLTQTQLAERVGTTKNQLVKLESGARRMSDHWAARVAPHIGVQPYELFMTGSSHPSLRQVPLVAIISNGDWQQAIAGAARTVPTTTGGPNAFALTSQGDSMNMLIEPDGYVVVDPDLRELIDGKVFVVMNGSGEASVRRYLATPPRLAPCSTNPAHQETLIGSEPFIVIGRVIFRASEV
jgi:repressor LexA